MAPSGSGGRARRHKISLACEPCRVRKSRCDGGKPLCSTCERRGLALDRCVYKIEQNARMASNDEWVSGLPLEGARGAQLTYSLGTSRCFTSGFAIWRVLSGPKLGERPSMKHWITPSPQAWLAVATPRGILHRSQPRLRMAPQTASPRPRGQTPRVITASRGLLVR